YAAHKELTMLEVTMVGCGAIGRGVLESLLGDADVCGAQMITRTNKVAIIRAEIPDIAVAGEVGALQTRPQLRWECAAHGAGIEHVLPALGEGVDCVLISNGALSEPGLPEQLEQAARDSGAQVQLIAGAVGAIDAIAAARVGGLNEVT